MKVTFEAEDGEEFETLVYPDVQHYVAVFVRGNSVRGALSPRTCTRYSKQGIPDLLGMMHASRLRLEQVWNGGDIPKQ